MPFTTCLTRVLSNSTCRSLLQRSHVPSDQKEMKSQARWGFLASLAILVPSFLLSLYAGWPSNVLNPSGSDPIRKHVAMTVPQGWAFFTKPPDDPEIGVYEARTGKSILATPQTKAANLFGLSRAQRAQGPELASLAAQVTRWEDCDAGAASCIEPRSGEHPQGVSNDAFIRTVCGRVVLTSERPAPWAYRGFGLSSRIDQRAFLDVDCSGRTTGP
ncbi:SdpA family antimicrobial peptide system protein [Leifsonia shinshuensis]